METKSQAFIEYFLRWENREIVFRKIPRACFREHVFPPEEESRTMRDKFTDQVYHHYVWDVCQLADDVQINIVLDRLSPDNPTPRKYRMHSHDFFEILYVYSGTCRTNLFGREKDVCTGDICLYNMQSVHRVVKNSLQDVAFSIMIRKDLFQTAFVSLLQENDMISDFFIQSIYNVNNRAGQIVLHRNGAFECEALLQKMIEVFYRDEPMAQSRLKALLLLLLNEITRQYRAEHTHPAKEDDRLDLAEVVEYMDAHFDNVSIEALAARFNYTAKTMSRFIKRQTDLTFRELLQKIRFQHACDCLCDRNMSIEEIALRMGYTERANFDRAFKSRYHLTPVEFRRINLASRMLDGRRNIRHC